ncbi:MAG: glycosyltransferase [Polyangiaceae bacterium]
MGLLPARHTIGFVGRLAPEKRVDQLIAALDHLPDGTQLVVVGDGPLREALTQRSEQLRRGAVHFAGRVSSPAALNRFYNAFDLLVLPSESEGFPAVLLESLAAGTKTLASDLSGPRALLGDGECGSLSRARDAVELAAEIRAALELATNPERLRERAGGYSWQAVCATHAAILDA